MERDRQDLPLAPETIHQILRRSIRAVVGHCQDLEDLVQGAWLKLLTQRERLAEVDRHALAGYIWKIGQRSTIDHLRAQKALKRGGRAGLQELPPNKHLPSGDPSPERQAIARAALEEALATAAGSHDSCRAILRLFYLEGVPAHAVAEQQGISIHTVYSTLSRARQRLVAARPG